MSLFDDQLAGAYQELRFRLRRVPAADIAEGAGLHVSTVFAVREGKLKTYPHMETLRSIEAALDDWGRYNGSKTNGPRRSTTNVGVLRRTHSTN